MRNGFRTIILVVVMLVAGVVKGQDPQFSQFYAAQLYLNPAFTGSTQLTRAGINYRNQWPSIEASYVTYMATFDHYFIGANSGVGLMVLSDRETLAGLRNQGISALYAYQLPIASRWTLRAGFQAGYYIRDLDYSKLTFGDQFDDSGMISPVTGEVFDTDWNVNYVDLSTGFLFYNSNLWVGFAIHHLTKPNLSFFNESQGLEDRMPRKYSVHAGYKINLRGGYQQQVIGGRNQKELNLYPALNYRLQGEAMQFDVGAYLNYSSLNLGIWYRGIPFRSVNGINNNEAIVFSVGLSKGGLNIGYSFDYTLSALGIQSGGAHEVSISYQFFLGDPRKPPKSMREIPCPRL